MRTLALHCVLPLAVGALLYLLRPSLSLLGFDWLRSVTTIDLRVSLPAMPRFAHWPPWLVFSGSGLLWSYSSVAWICWVWREQQLREKSAWIFAAASLGPVSEFAQGLGWLPGTFDTMDLMLTAVGAIAAVAMHGGRSGECAKPEAVP